MRITITAPAKVNLWLRMGSAGGDGYHPFDTLYCGLELADARTTKPGAVREL